jgi:La domain
MNKEPEQHSMTEATKAKAEDTAATQGATASTEDAPTSGDNLQAVVEGVMERLRFFFSDANVRQDVFLRKLLMNKEDGRSVPVKTLLRFNTVKKHTEDPAVVIRAATELGDVLVVDKEKAALQLVIPFTVDMMNGNIPKSLYVKNLP